jgi:hypothetical protein
VSPLSLFVPFQPFRPTSNNHSSLLGLFVSYKEKKKISMQTVGPYSQHFTLFATY